MLRCAHFFGAIIDPDCRYNIEVFGPTRVPRSSVGAKLLVAVVVVALAGCGALVDLDATPRAPDASAPTDASLDGTVDHEVDAAGDADSPELMVTALALGDAHTCALVEGGAVKCWGNNFDGQLGLGTSTPELLASGRAVDFGGRKARAIAAGANHSCAVLENGDVACWGQNRLGQLGLGDTDTRGDQAGEIAGAIVHLTDDANVKLEAVALSAGAWHTCAQFVDGRVKCWGDNSVGQLGIGGGASHGRGPDQMGPALPFVDLGVGRTAKILASGQDHNCALLDDYSVQCWGLNTAKTTDQPKPAGNKLPNSLAAGQVHSCLTNTEGTVRCWGSNLNGELGSAMADAGTGAPAGQNAIQVTAGGAFTCTLEFDATVRCWGLNGFGQLGAGDTVNRSTPSPVPVDGSPGRIVQVIAGGGHACVRFDVGKIKCWGRNDKGQLGLGTHVQQGDDPGEMASLPFVVVR